jgi:putative two-component system response regulator
MSEPMEERNILIIDDEAVLRQSLCYFLEDREYNVQAADDGQTGLELMAEYSFDLVITDLRMPRVDGMEILDYMKEHLPETPVIVISGANRMDDAIQALRRGAWDFLTKPIHDLTILEYTVKSVIEKADLIKENKKYHNQLELLVKERTAELEYLNRQLELSRRQIIGILSQAAEYRDFGSSNHFTRVSKITECISRGLGISEEEAKRISLAAPMHDLGKIGIPDEILLKEGKLNETEWEIMKKHCRYGDEILRSNDFVDSFCNLDHLKLSAEPPLMTQSFINTAAIIALNHHEHWDGSGYPIGLQGEDIPLEARITAVADVFDTLCSDRPYKKAWPVQNCIDFLKEQRGKHFDPRIIDVFLEYLPDINSIEQAMGNCVGR